MRTTICSITLLALAATASAGTKADVTMPDTVRVGGETLVLNGMGLREATFLNVDVYVAGLYLEKPSSDAAAILAADDSKVLVLRFVRDVDRDDIVKAWRDGFRNNAKTPVAQLQPSIDRLSSWMPAFHSGDTMTFTYVPERGVHVTINGERKGTIEGADFARSLFSVWLGPKPPNAGLKAGLLGSHGKR
jgi:hypothetical protein